MSYKFRANYKFGCYELVIRHHDLMSVLNLDAEEMIELCDAIDFYREKAEHEISKTKGDKACLK